MSTLIEDDFREQLTKFLPDALAKALNSYQAFMGKGIPIDEAKAFSDHHNAGKVAMAHIKLLLAFAREVDLPDPAAGSHNDQILLAAVMQEAEEELQRYRGENEEDDE